MNNLTLPESPCAQYLKNDVILAPFIISVGLIVVAFICCCYGIVFQVPVYMRSLRSDEVWKNRVDEEAGETRTAHDISTA